MKSILWGMVVSAVAILAFVGWLVMKAPRGTVAQTGVPAVVKPQRELTRQERHAKTVITFEMETNGEVHFRDFYTTRGSVGDSVLVHFDLIEWNGEKTHHRWDFSFSGDGEKITHTNRGGTLSKPPTIENRVESIRRRIQRDLGDHRTFEFLDLIEKERDHEYNIIVDCKVLKPNGTSVKKRWEFGFEKNNNAMLWCDSSYY